MPKSKYPSKPKKIPATQVEKKKKTLRRREYLIHSRKEPAGGDGFFGCPTAFHGRFSTRHKARRFVEKNLLDLFNRHCRETHECDIFVFPCQMKRTESDDERLAEQREEEGSDFSEGGICPGPERMDETVAIKVDMDLPETAEVVDSWGIESDRAGCWIQVIELKY